MALALFLADDRAESRVYRCSEVAGFSADRNCLFISLFLFFCNFLSCCRIREPPSTLFICRSPPAVGCDRRRLCFEGGPDMLKSLLGRMAIFLLIFAVAEVLYDYVEVRWHVPLGTWYELLWTIPRVLMVWLAATWSAPEKVEPSLKEGG